MIVLPQATAGLDWNRPVVIDAGLVWVIRDVEWLGDFAGAYVLILA